MNNKPRCECKGKSRVPKSREYMYSENEKIGMNHEPDKCKCTNNLRQYWRNGRKIWLCSCCVIFDKPVKVGE